MRFVQTNPYLLSERFIGLTEVPGQKDNAQILAMLRLDGDWPDHDEVPWCSAFLNYIAWSLRLPRSKSLAARSWLTVGQSVGLAEAEVGFDVVILKRGDGRQPGPEVRNADGSWPPGHVTLYAGQEQNGTRILGQGGNQGNTVSVASFPASRLLGIRRIG